MHRRFLIPLFGALLLAAFGAASAQDAYTSRPMNVRAGPDRDYPLVAQLDAGAPLEVHGCLSDWSWCDVSFDGNRGWIYSGGLSFVYQGERVPLYSYGPSLGLPIITFSLMTYWNDYYRGRPWYAQRDTWAHRRMPPHMVPRGRPHAGPPPMMGHGAHPMQGRPAPRGQTHGRGAPQEHATPQGRGMPQEHGAPQERGGPPQGREAPRGRGPQQSPRGGRAPQSKGSPSSHGGGNQRDHGGGDQHGQGGG